MNIFLLLIIGYHFMRMAVLLVVFRDLKLAPQFGTDPLKFFKGILFHLLIVAWSFFFLFR